MNRTEWLNQQEFKYDYRQFRYDPQAAGIWGYRGLLPVGDPDAVVTLGEGQTPLLRSNQDFGCPVYLKNETNNPTGSMKDRALSVAVSKAKELGRRRVIIASTGSAGISAAAYAARASIGSTILVPSETPAERLVAMYMLGAAIVKVNGTIEALIDIVGQASRQYGWMNVSTFKEGNPFQSEGAKTIAYEIFSQLGRCPEYLFIPVGGGGTLSAIWNGFKDLVELGWAEMSSLPKIVAVQHENYNSLELALRSNLSTKEQLLQLAATMDETKPCMAKNIQHTYCMDGVEALQAIRESGGDSVSVSDAEITAALRDLSEKDGVFAEPSSATTLAAIRKAEKEHRLRPGDTVVSLITGSGFRETAAAIQLYNPVFAEVSKENCLDHLGGMER